jgi:hypothetical protein
VRKQLAYGVVAPSDVDTVAKAAEARGVWAARQLAARVSAVAWERACAEEESQLAKVERCRLNPKP